MATIGEGEKVTQGEIQIFYFRIHQFIHQIYPPNLYPPTLYLQNYLSTNIHYAISFQPGRLSFGQYWQPSGDPSKLVPWIQNCFGISGWFS